MELRQYWAVLSKGWMVVVIVAFVASLSAYAYSKLQQPIFRSSAKLYVMPARPDYGNVLFSQNVVRQYSQLLTSDRLLTRVSDELRLDLSVVTMKRKVTTTGTVENLAIQMDVDDTDPGRARAIARQLALDFIEDQDARMKDISKDNRIDVRMYDDPTSAALYSPKTKSNVVAGGLLGLLLGGIIVFLLEYLDDTIRSPEDVERHVALPVMGSIPGGVVPG